MCAYACFCVCARRRGVATAVQVVDKYGVPYVLASRGVGLVVIFATYFALKGGLDVGPFLARIGMTGAGTRGVLGLLGLRAVCCVCACVCVVCVYVCCVV
ncbi:MAG: hypothetical protein P4L40_01325 [Terracidiphilus sp.]|nr:hypothetical protein [Terracidiphilus sp.]